MSSPVVGACGRNLALAAVDLAYVDGVFGAGYGRVPTYGLVEKLAVVVDHMRNSATRLRREGQSYTGTADALDRSWPVIQSYESQLASLVGGKVPLPHSWQGALEPHLSVVVAAAKAALP